MQFWLLLLILLPPSLSSDHLPTCEEEMMMNLEDCHQVEEKECGLCHDIYMKECAVHLHVSFVPVKVRECLPLPDCEPGGSRKCTTRYRKECHTEVEWGEQEERRPMCGVIMVHNCSAVESDTSEEERCNEVPVMKCQMEKMITKKESPKTTCRSLPEEICEDQTCLNCFNKVSMKRAIEPREECEYKKKRVCQATDSGDCVTKTRTVCKPSSHLMIQKLCSQEYDWRLHQMP